MTQRLNRALLKAIGSGSGRTLRQRLAMTTILAVVPFLGYGRQAYAACDTTNAPIVVCSDTISGDNLNYNNADVSTLASPPFEVTDDGLFIYGNGHIQFHDDNASIINNKVDNGLDVQSHGDDGGTPGAVTIDANSIITGESHGIYARNEGSGDIDITFDGSVSGARNNGINAANLGDNLRITTGAGSNVYGYDYGIRASNDGEGDLEIKANGVVTGHLVSGIYANNSSSSENLKITAGAASVVTGGDHGIYARNKGDGDLEVEADGVVTGKGRDGIYAYNGGREGFPFYGYGHDLTITTGAASDVTGFDDGIDAENYGDGNLTITANGRVTGEGDNGIEAFNSGIGDDLTITTGAGSDVVGKYNGINAENIGDGNLTITANGKVTGYVDDGITAFNNFDGDDLTITTGAGSDVTGEDIGIDAENRGDGDLTITANGKVTGLGEDGIYADNDNDGHDLTISTGAASAVRGEDDGIDANNDGHGDLEITVRGSSVGEDSDGIEADNSSDGHDLTITTEVGSVVIGQGDDGMDVDQDGQGDLDITVKGAVTGLEGEGIESSKGGNGETNIKVEASGLVQGNNTAIDASSDDGQDINIINDGTVRNLSTNSDDRAIYAHGGAADITTNGVLIGTVATDLNGTFDDEMENSGFWNPSGGNNEFGDGDDEFTNTATGTLLAADDPTVEEETLFVLLEKFSNAGLVSLVDGQAGDHLLLIDGAEYEGDDGRLAVDAVLGPSGLSDELLVGGDVTGTPTRVHVNVAGATGANTEGIPVVRVEGNTADGDFVLDGPLNAGFFTWDLRKDDGGQEWHELFTSGVGVGSYEFAAGISGGQEVWHQTTGTLLQRQADLRALLNGTGVTPVADFGEPVAPTPTAHITPGFWLRGLGAYVERDDEENGFTLDRKQTIWGGMAGFDFGSEGAGDVWMFGLFGGYVTSDLDFTETNSEWTYEGPTVGAYVSYLDQGLHADVTVKADFLDVNIDPDDLAPASDDEDTDALNLGARLDAGYKFGGTLFIEPQATLAVLHTEIDDVDIFGGTVEFDDQTSFRGRLGLRVGFDHTDSMGTVYSADVTGSAWEDFSDDNEVTIANSGLPNFSVSDDPGQTIGDVSLGFSAASPEGLSGFLRGNYLFGTDYEAVTGNAGVRWAW